VQVVTRQRDGPWIDVASGDLRALRCREDSDCSRSGAHVQKALPSDIAFRKSVNQNTRRPEMDGVQDFGVRKEAASEQARFGLAGDSSPCVRPLQPAEDTAAKPSRKIDGDEHTAVSEYLWEARRSKPRLASPREAVS
jgi:hypothetical protein